MWTRIRARLPRPVAAVAALALALSVAAGLASVAPGIANAAGAVSSKVDPLNGFPTWYQDSAGNRVEPCIDPNDPNCVLPAGTAFDASQPVAFPTNFPDEFFYSIRRVRERGHPRLRRDRSGPRSGDPRAGGRVRQRRSGGGRADGVRPDPGPRHQRPLPEHDIPVPAPVRNGDAHDRPSRRHRAERRHPGRRLRAGPARPLRLLAGEREPGDGQRDGRLPALGHRRPGRLPR